MYAVKETYIAKPGYAGRLADMMKEEMGKDPSFKNSRVLLDMITDYNKIVCEYEIESLVEFEVGMTEHIKKKAKKKNAKPPEYTQYYLTGKREIFRIL